MPWGKPPPDDRLVCVVCGQRGGAGIGMVELAGADIAYCLPCWRKKIEKEEAEEQLASMELEPTIDERLNALAKENRRLTKRVEALEKKLKGIHK